MGVISVIYWLITSVCEIFAKLGTYIKISESDILEVLTSLDPTKASGLDNIGPNLLKYCSIALAAPLHHLFSMCIHQCNIPSE